MNRAALIIMRVATIALVAAVFIGLAGVYDHSLRPLSHELTRKLERELRRGPSMPQRSGVFRFIAELGLFGLITVGGRKVLRLRL